MSILPIIYLIYMFISLYFLALFLAIYFTNRKTIFSYPSPKKNYTVSFIVPAYNEEKTIADTLEHIYNIEYDGIREVIVINDNSKDETLNILKEHSKKYQNLRILSNPINLGKAGSINRALKIAGSELVAVVDADSYPSSDSIKSMVGFFNDEKVGAVTCPIVARNTNIFFEKLQSIEYKVIAFSRKLLDYVDAIYVTPGPLALYRKSALIEIGGFDEKNMTEDIEATWNLAANGWDRRMSLSASVSSTVPSKFKAWYRQRRRWNVGGLQCMYKYKNFLFNYKKGSAMLGFFIVPFFICSTFLGLVGLSIWAYLIIRRAFSWFLYTRYSIVANTALVTIEDFYITPNFLNYIGVILFLAGLIFTLVILSILKERIFIKENLLNIPFYMLIYISFYPFIMLSSIWHVLRGKNVWR